MTDFLELGKFVNHELWQQLTKPRLDVYGDGPAPIIGTAAGDIRFKPAQVIVSPVPLQIIRLHELFLRSQGVESGFALSAVAALSPLYASRAYFAGQAAILGQLFACPVAQRLELAAGILNTMTVLKQRDGLEFLLLSCAAALDFSSADHGSSGQGADPIGAEVQDILRVRLPELWELLDGVYDQGPQPLTEGTDRDRSRHMFSSLVSPVLFPQSGTVRFVARKDVGSLLAGLQSIPDLTAKIDEIATQGLATIGMKVEEVMDNEYDRCVGQMAAIGAIVGAVAGVVITGSTGAGAVAVGAGAVVGGDIGEKFGGFIGSQWCGSDVAKGDSRSSSAVVSSANDASKSGSTTGTQSSTDGSTQSSGGSSSSSGTREDESAVCRDDDDDKGKPNPSEFASSRFATLALAGPGLRAMVMQRGPVLALTSMPRLASDGRRFADPGIFASLPGAEKIETVTTIEGIRDVLQVLSRQR